ncbi:MAG: extracellular solute-binding protein [Lachnospiraceae bacterium]|nr:extracellular solute-binding protein [Lachnospiraceae bacterium]
MKKRFGLIVGIGALVLGMSGCGQADEPAGEVASVTEEPIVLDWYVNYTWYNTPWGGNIVSEKITEDTGISINFQAPMGNAEEKFNALISSDTLPDIITLGWWEDQVDEMIEKEMVYALNVLADEYDTLFWQVADQEAVNWYTREDGNIYCYPNSSYSPSDYENYNVASNQTFLVRKDIYEALGCPDMTTTEGFIDAVRRAAEEFPTVDGEPLIPIGAHIFDSGGCVSFDQYLQNFLAVPYEKENGDVYDRYTDPDFVTWLKAFRQLGEEGYLKEDIFIDQRAQMEEKLSKGRYFCMLYQRTDMADQQAALYANHPERVYIAVDGPRNAAGDDPVLPGAGINGWTVTLISKNCEHPDKAISLLSYLMSDEGQKLIYLGVEGVTYDMVDGKAVVKEEVRRLLNTDREQYDALYGADNAYWMLQDNATQLQWSQPLTEPNGQLEEWTYPYSHYLAQYETSYDSNTEAGNADSNIKRLWGKTLPKLLLAPTEEEFDAIFADFVEQREQLGYELVCQESKKMIQDAKKRLGME